MPNPKPDRTPSVHPFGELLKPIRKITGILWASPYTLLGLLIGTIGLLFGSRVRVQGRAIEFYDGGVKWFIHQIPYGQYKLAFTLGHVVLGQTKASLEISRKHEAVYIAQYERWGPLMIPAYYIASVYVWLVGRRFYRDNPFEREAINVDRQEYLLRVSRN